MEMVGTDWFFEDVTDAIQSIENDLIYTTSFPNNIR